MVFEQIGTSVNTASFEGPTHAVALYDKPGALRSTPFHSRFTDFKQEGSSNLPYLLWHETSVYTALLEGPPHWSPCTTSRGHWGPLLTLILTGEEKKQKKRNIKILAKFFQMYGNVDILTVFEVLAQELMTTMSIVNIWNIFKTSAVMQQTLLEISQLLCFRWCNIWKMFVFFLTFWNASFNRPSCIFSTTSSTMFCQCNHIQQPLW